MGVADRDWSRAEAPPTTEKDFGIESARSKDEASVVKHRKDTLRNPSYPLAMRLEALDELIGRRLTGDEKATVKVYTAELARLVAEAGEVVTRTTTYHVEGGVLRRKLNF